MNAVSTVLAAVRADDALLDALGGRTPQPPTDALSVALSAWARDVDQPAVGVLVPIGRAVWVLRRSRWTARASRFLACFTRRSR